MTRRLQPLSFGLHGLAILWLGLMAGFFWTYSANVGLATAQMDGATYATVQSALNRNVRHAVFFCFFFGPPLWCALALITAVSEWRLAWWWALAVAALLYVGGIIVLTARVNLPLNAYTESWNPQALPGDWQSIREKWNVANLWRTVINAVAFALSVLALATRPRARDLGPKR